MDLDGKKQPEKFKDKNYPEDPFKNSGIGKILANEGQKPEGKDPNHHAHRELNVVTDKNGPGNTEQTA